MSTEQITCVCPHCRSAYRVLARTMGNHARCRTCGRTFLVANETPPPATDDDVLNWLREAEEQDDAA